MKKPKPTAEFELDVRNWRRIYRACRACELYVIASSINRHIASRGLTNNLKISVPIESCIGIAQACASYGLGIGIEFATAASSHTNPKHVEKPVDADWLKIAKEELEHNAQE